MTEIRRVLRTVSAALIGVLTASCGSDKITTTTIDFQVSEGSDLAFDLSPDGQTIFPRACRDSNAGPLAPEANALSS